MDRPFRELHEIYRIVYLKAEKQAQDEEKRKAKEAEEKKKEQERSRGSYRSPMYQNRPTDVMPTNQMDTLSPAQAEALEDALEDLM